VKSYFFRFLSTFYSRISFFNCTYFVNIYSCITVIRHDQNRKYLKNSIMVAEEESVNVYNRSTNKNYCEIDECVKRLSYSFITKSNLVSWRHALAAELGGNVLLSNKRLSRVEEEKKRLLLKIPSVSTIPNKMKFKDMEEELKKTNFRICEYSKDLARDIKNHPKVMKNLEKLEGDRIKLVAILEHLSNDCSVNSEHEDLTCLKASRREREDLRKSIVACENDIAMIKSEFESTTKAPLKTIVLEKELKTIEEKVIEAKRRMNKENIKEIIHTRNCEVDSTIGKTSRCAIVKSENDLKEIQRSLEDEKKISSLRRKEKTTKITLLKECIEREKRNKESELLRLRDELDDVLKSRSTQFEELSVSTCIRLSITS